MNAAGSSTNALASASGLSRTMAISISPPSFWMRAGRPACICSRIATVLFRTGCVSIPLGLSVPRCQFVVNILGCWRPQCEDKGTVRQRGGRQVCDSGYCSANFTIFDFIRRDDFCQWPARSQPKVAAVCILSLVPYIFGSTLHYETIGVLCDLFLLNLFSCRILLACRRALVGLQIDECNIAGRHHQCVTAIPLAWGNLLCRLW